MSLDINNYTGSKNGMGVSQWIINHIPAFYYCHELFGGSAIISRKLMDLTEDKIFYIYEVYPPVYDQLIKLKLSELNSVSIFNNDAIVTMSGVIDNIPNKNKNFFKNVFFYLDPPYIKSTRRSSRNIYGQEWDMLEHIKLLNLVLELDKLGANVLISHYNSELYNEKLDGWKTDTFQTMTRGGKVLEKIYMNYDISKMDLATYEFLGDNFSDRQRIKKRKESYLAKFQKMKPLERKAILQHIEKNL